MVRLIAAGLVEVGHGRITPAKFKKLLLAGDRTGLPVEAAPPHGLYLEQVRLESSAAAAMLLYCAAVSMPSASAVTHLNHGTKPLDSDSYTERCVCMWCLLSSHYTNNPGCVLLQVYYELPAGVVIPEMAVAALSSSDEELRQEGQAVEESIPSNE